MAPRMRLGVVGVFLNSDGKLLLCQRSNDLGAWQFPQGGVDEGETIDAAILREMTEELGTDKFTILKKSEDSTEYFFPKDLASSIVKRFDGQVHFWYLLNFKAHAGPRLARSDGEFNDHRWVELRDVLDMVVAWKREAYAKGLGLLGIL